MTAAAYAQLGAMPMMMITGPKPVKASKQGRFQIVGTVAMMRPIIKYARQIVDGHTIPSVVREASAWPSMNALVRFTLNCPRALQPKSSRNKSV